MGRRRPVGRKIYTLSSLLEKQPKSLQKMEHYPLLIDFLNNSPELYALRFNKRCFSLLNSAVIKPEHLDNFYKTYRLPKHPFFPLFFMIKREYMKERELKKIEREMYISRAYEQIAPHIKEFFRRLEELEKMYNPSGRTPFFLRNLYPGTKKKVDSYRYFSHREWISCFELYFKRLQAHYDRLPKERCDKLLASFILLSIPSSLYFQPNETILKEHYRTLCKEYHPDSGGDSLVFIKVKWARDLLLPYL